MKIINSKENIVRFFEKIVRFSLQDSGFNYIIICGAYRRNVFVDRKDIYIDESRNGL